MTSSKDNFERSSTMLAPLVTVMMTMMVVVCVVREAGATNGEEVRMPPSIIRGPILEKTFRPDSEILLECIANGYPEPKYTWLKDGHLLESRPNVVYTGAGTIRIDQLSRLDEGKYQCRAENKYGASLSNTSTLRYAYIGTYSSGTTAPVEYRDLEEGKPYVLKNTPLKSVPAATYSWHVGESTTDTSPRGIITDNRVQIDEEGNLHFAYLKTSDSQNNKVYKCNVFNPIVDSTVGGSYSRLFVTPRGLREYAPVRSFASKSPVVAVLGRNVTLRCFFSGFPEPTLTWSKIQGDMPRGRYEPQNFNSKLLITDVRQSDEGDYRCRAANTANVGGSIADEIIQIDVQSEPSFSQPTYRPTNTNATEGDTVVFTCNATAKPSPNIVWMRNGDQLTESSMPPRMRIINNGLQLAIDKVCKNCVDGSRDSDLMVIQCNANNVHGDLFSDAYLNVLERTMITVRPQDVHLEYDKLTAEFQCVAVTDASTPLTVSWFRVMDDGNPDVAVRSSAPFITVSDNGTRLSFRVTEDSLEAWREYRGKYRCEATNGYSRDVAPVTLVVDDPPPTSPPFIVPDDDLTSNLPRDESLVGASLADFWWILAIAAAVLLFIIIVIICCLCCRRCKGDTYFVDKTERKDRKDPEKELHESAIQPYNRRDTDALKGSRPSLGDSLKGDSDDEDDLNEYGDIDAGKFTEDGSFIGDYADEQRKRGQNGDYDA